MAETTIRSPHIQLARKYWKEHLKPNDLAIDATCGNGHDTLFLSELILTPDGGEIVGFDIQQRAIQNTRKRLEEYLPAALLNQVFLFQESHAKIDEISLKKTPSLIVYNLGYLPGGEKEMTTLTETSLTSIQKSLRMIPKNGAISITCYPGHSEGEKEEREISSFLSTLPSHEWLISHHSWVNRPKSPSLFWIIRT